MNTNKKITKIITFYEDGSFSEYTPYVGAPMPIQPMNPSNKPNTPIIPGPWWSPVPEKPKCSKCGLVMESVMGYCCPHSDCPTGMGPIMCGVGSK